MREGVKMKGRSFVITISHQLGSGGAYLGEKLSERLGIPFLDREILIQVARQLHLAEAELEHREERLSSFWQSFSRTIDLANPDKSLTADHYVPTDRDLFQFECDTISRIAEKSSAIFIGRCGRCVLRVHPRHFNVLVHARKPARIKRLGELFKLSQAEAEKLIETNDKERADYIRTFTKENWLDARLYDLCVDTSSIGFDNTVELILAGMRAKLPQESE
jgi:CMP/dCMP kinase